MRIEFKYGDKEFQTAKISYGRSGIVTVTVPDFDLRFRCHHGYDLFKVIWKGAGYKLSSEGKYALMDDAGHIYPERYKTVKEVFRAGMLQRDCRFPDEKDRFKCITVRISDSGVEF